jgi:hypothetical protein
MLSGKSPTLRLHVGMNPPDHAHHATEVVWVMDQIREFEESIPTSLARR